MYFIIATGKETKTASQEVIYITKAGQTADPPQPQLLQAGKKTQRRRNGAWRWHGGYVLGKPGFLVEE